ncbi:hypothetical protein CPC08DRAFT_708418 [Agrocybe pediades]|nr:hypothetical protein CPC08DRAFT_708418 [Agrocybe pediades]
MGGAEREFVVAVGIAGICYGFLATLCFSCCSLLLRSKHLYSRRMRLFFLFYVVTMLLLSTGAIIEEISLLRASSAQGAELNPFLSTLVPYTVPLIVLGADGLLMWRCKILYQGISRAGEWLLNVVLGLLLVATLALGMSYYVYQLHPNSDKLTESISTLALSYMSPVVNIVLAILLAARILYLQARLSRLLGSAMSQQSPYTKIAIMCIESSALIFVFGVIFIIALFNPSSFDGWIPVPFFLFPHICVISPVLIIYRVAQGRSIEVMTSDSNGGRVSTLNFSKFERCYYVLQTT